MSFLSRILTKYSVEASLPTKEKPPLSIATWIKTCNELGRKDLGAKIQKRWDEIYDDPTRAKVRTDFAIATALGCNSIKKNVFGGKDFTAWLKENNAIATPEQTSSANVSTEMPKGTPAIAVPKKDETVEDWLREAMKTKMNLLEAKAAFGEVRHFVAHLEKEIGDLERKIQTYGKGGEKSGHKYAERIPKWEIFLKTHKEVLAETKSSVEKVESNFKDAMKSYEGSPIQTSAFEQKVQANVENILEYVLNMKDLQKQKELLEKLNTALDPKGDKAVEGAVGDRILSFLEKIKEGFKAVKIWVKSLSKSVDKLSELTNLRF